jgi:hypothetical protein
MRRRRLARTILPALALILPLVAAPQALLPPASAPNEWAVFRDGGAPSACYVCRRTPRPKDCPGAEVAQTAAPTRCESFALGRDLLRRGDCTKVALREFTVADCMPR